MCAGSSGEGNGVYVVIGECPVAVNILKQNHKACDNLEKCRWSLENRVPSRHAGLGGK